MSGNGVQIPPDISVTGNGDVNVMIKHDVELQVFECSRRSEADAKRTDQEAQEIKLMVVDTKGNVDFKEA